MEWVNEGDEAFRDFRRRVVEQYVERHRPRGPHVSAVVEWVAQAAFAGIIGNYAYHSVVEHCRRIRARWKTHRDPEQWLTRLISEGEWERLRILRHPEDAALVQLDVFYAERSEIVFLRLMKEDAEQCGSEPPSERES